MENKLSELDLYMKLVGSNKKVAAPEQLPVLKVNFKHLTSVSRIEKAIKDSNLQKEIAVKAIVPHIRKAVAHEDMPLLNAYKVYMWSVNNCSMADSVTVFEAVRNGKAASNFQKAVEKKKGKFIYPYASASFTDSETSSLCKKPIRWYRELFEVVEDTPDGFNIFLWDVLKNPRACVPMKERYRTVDFIHPTGSKFYYYDFRVFGYRAPKPKAPVQYIHSQEGDVYMPEISDSDCTIYNTHRADTINQANSMLDEMVHPRKDTFYKYADDAVYQKRIGIRFAASSDRVMEKAYYDTNVKAAELLKGMPEDVVNESLTVAESLPNKGVYTCPDCGHKVTAWDYKCPVCHCENKRCVRSKWNLESYEYTKEDEETGEELDTVGSVAYEQDYDYLDTIGGEDPVEPIEGKGIIVDHVNVFTRPRLVKKERR